LILALNELFPLKFKLAQFSASSRFRGNNQSVLPKNINPLPYRIRGESRMKKWTMIFAVCVALAVAFVAPPATQATTITFDVNFPSCTLNSEGALPESYAKELGIEKWSSGLHYFSTPDTLYPPGSSPKRIYVHNGTAGWVKFSQLVDFESVWLAEAAGTSAGFGGYKNGILVYLYPPPLSPLIAGPFQETVNLNWAGIDELRFFTTTANSAVWDDFKFSPAASVPLPSALLLFGTGGSGLLWWRTRRRSKSA
jgi:hypothetical protein